MALPIHHRPMSARLWLTMRSSTMHMPADAEQPALPDGTFDRAMHAGYLTWRCGCRHVRSSLTVYVVLRTSERGLRSSLSW
jgi:hypothetical protein